MSKILELREKRAKAWEAAKKFLDSKRGEDGLLSAEDTAAYEKMEKEVVDLGKEIERLERQAAIDAELNKPTSEPSTTADTHVRIINTIGHFLFFFCRIVLRRLVHWRYWHSCLWGGLRSGRSCRS